MKKNRGNNPIEVIIHIYMEISQGNSLSSYLYNKQAKMLFFSFVFYKIGEQEGGTRAAQGSWYQWEGKGSRERG
jgi:hypothetical protein